MTATRSARARRPGCDPAASGPVVGRRRAALAALGWSAAALAAVGAPGYWYAHSVAPAELELVRRDVSLARLPTSFEGITIAQISDLHLGPNVGAAMIRAAVDRLMAEQP